MLKCFDCGKTYEEAEYKGGHWGCPYCGCTEADKLPECDRCGEPYDEEYVYCGLCKDCREEIKSDYRFDVDGCYALAENEPKAVMLNTFLAEMLPTEEIEEILLRELRQAKTDCTRFIESDEDWFFDRVLEKEVK